MTNRSLPPPSQRRLSLAACAVVVAASLNQASAAEEPAAIEQMQRYCTSSWRNAGIRRQDWDDCTQQAIIELISRVSRSGLVPAMNDQTSSERRELNRSIWCTVQRWRRLPRIAALHEEQAVDHEAPTQTLEGLSLAELRELIGSEEAGLSERQQDVLNRWLDGASVAEIAAALDIPAARVSDEKYKAVRKLRAWAGAAA